MAISSIEWTEHTWNPVVGCSIVSPGCTNCYAMRMAARIEAINAASRPGHTTAPHYAGTTKKVNGRAVWTGKLALAGDDILLAPLKRKKPTTYFVNSMGDLFHEDCPDEWIDRVFAVMALCPQHTFQVLTKRAARMRDYFADVSVKIHVAEAALSVGRNLPHGHLGFHPSNDAWTVDHLNAQTGNVVAKLPLPNVWLGVSAERQQEADERIPLLLRTPAAIRFVSAEPLLGPIDLTSIAWGSDHIRFPESDDISDAFSALHVIGGKRLDWVIAGGESGPDSRPMHPDWARSLRDQCAAASVSFFFKQWGSWYPMIDRDEDDPDWRRDYTLSKSDHKYRILNLAGGQGFHGERVHLMQRYSKKASGKLLDGVEHQAMPELRESHRARAALEVSRG